MKEKKSILSSSQTKFVSYINENLNKSNRIIFYKSNGHFGLEYAIKSRFKKAKILSFKELKSKKGKNIFFRILHIIAAIVFFILHIFKEIDVRTTVTTILNNMENIYLGIDKEKEYLKYLQIKKFPHRNSKIRFVIRISENDIETREDVQCLILLCKLIENQNINSTMLLISGELVNELNLGLKHKTEIIPLFQLQEEDLQFIAKENNLDVTIKISQNIELIKKFGLQFFIDNYNFFDVLAETQEEELDWIEKMELIMRQIINKNEVTTKQIYPLLEFASFFEKNFSKIEIQNFKDNQLEAENLDIAHKLKIINEKKASVRTVPTYSFKLEAFKFYFAAKYCSDLEPLPQFIFQYFREIFPFEYVSALKVLQINTSFIENKEKQSLIVTGYYYQSKEKGIVRCKDFICITTKDSIASIIIQLHECFKSGVQDTDFNRDISVILNKLKSNVLDAIATCASYVIILQFLKENYMYFFNICFSEVMADFMSSILEIESIDNYSKYWENHFKCQYIALALEDENANDRTARRFLDDIKKVKGDENFLAYISDNHLRGFTRIDLLAFSLAYDDAGKVLENLYTSSEESTILKELARINYGAYLVENELYHNAEILLNKGNLTFLENINVDTYCSYLNNLYLAQLGSRTIKTREYIDAMEELVCKNINCNDKLILKNNLYAAYLEDDMYASVGIEKLKEILENGNAYNRFLAIHNLLSFYFTKNDVKNFNNIYNQIEIPKLLLSDKTFFLNKFKWMKENIGQTSFENFKPNPYVTACYNQVYLRSSVERWFE